MSRAFNKTVVALFSEGMHRFPSWLPAKAPKIFAFPGGEQTYCWNNSGGSAWLSLLLSPKGRNEFNVEVGWSQFGRYPELRRRPSHFALADVRFDADPEGFVRLNPNGNIKADWWSICRPTDDLAVRVQHARAPLDAAESLRLALPLVQDALVQVETSGVPFINQFLRHQRKV